MVDPYFSQFLTKLDQSYTYQDTASGKYHQMECVSEINMSEQYNYTPFVKGWGIDESQTNIFDVSKDNEVEDMISGIDDLPGVKTKAEIKAMSSQHLKYKHIDESLGHKLLAPIRGDCQIKTIDDWRYNFCLGKSVDHVHIENAKEAYVMGNATKNHT